MWTLVIFKEHKTPVFPKVHEETVPPYVSSAHNVWIYVCVAILQIVFLFFGWYVISKLTRTFFSSVYEFMNRNPWHYRLFAYSMCELNNCKLRVLNAPTFPMNIVNDGKLCHFISKSLTRRIVFVLTMILKETLSTRRKMAKKKKAFNEFPKTARDRGWNSLAQS